MSEKYSHNLCRLCLYKSHNLIDIFDENGRHGYVAAEVIKDLLQITVHKYDRFPQNVCSICLDKLTDFKVFKDQCLECKTSFEQEFCLNTSYNEPKIVSVSPAESVSENCIKVEVKAEAEIIEIPADDLETRDISPVPSELDVETIDDEDNILYLESREVLGANGTNANVETPHHDTKGRFLKNKKKKKKSKNRQPSSKSDVSSAWMGTNTAAKDSHNTTPKKFDHNGGEGRTKCITGRASVKNKDSESRADILEGLLNKARKETLIDNHNWDNSVDDVKMAGIFPAVQNSNPSTVSPYFSTPENIPKETPRNSIDSEGLSGEHVLRRRSTHPYTYSEDNFLLTGENIQGYVDWGRWSPDKSQKKKRKLDNKPKSVPLKEPVTQGSVVETDDVNYSNASADGSVLEKTMEESDVSCDSSTKKDLTCHICGKAFLNKAALGSHRRTHPKMPFACDVCHKTFFRKDKLNAHRLSHSGIRPFGCNICTKAYTRLSHLTRHLLVHTRSNDPS